MKRTVLTLSFVLLVFFSCTQDESVSDIQQSKDLIENVPIEFGSLDLSKGVPLAKTNDSKGITASLKMLFSEINEMKNKNKEIGEVVLHLSEMSGVVTLQGYHLISKDQKILEFRHSSLSSQTESRWPNPIFILPAAACPNGYTDLGSCSNFGDTEECVGELISDHFSNSLNAPGDCANAQVQVGVLNTRVCGSTC